MKYLNTKLLVEKLTELSDVEIQRRLWTGAGGNEQLSLIEAIEGLFTDSGLGDALDHAETGFSPEVDSCLRDLRKQLTRIDLDRPPETVVADPAMAPVRRLATRLLGMLAAYDRM